MKKVLSIVFAIAFCFSLLNAQTTTACNNGDACHITFVFDNSKGNAFVKQTGWPTGNDLSSMARGEIHQYSFLTVNTSTENDDIVIHSGNFNRVELDNLFHNYLSRNMPSRVIIERVGGSQDLQGWSIWCNQTSCKEKLQQACRLCSVYGPCNECQEGTFALQKNGDGSGECACQCNGKTVIHWCWDMI